MALVPPPGNDRKRVKVYELKNNDWFDRGTGFCMGSMINDESKIFVESEDQPDRILLETRISKDDGYQKQQDTLIVWTESSGVDMALSFQEAEGCAAIWEFVSRVQQHLLALAGPDDALSDDAMETFPSPVVLPTPTLANLHEVEQIMRVAGSTQAGRDSLSKFVLGESYIQKIVPLVELAEGLEQLNELHRISTIMKTLILLNDTQIIELMMSDEVVYGVVGALEYDPEFPNHKANHREYLRNRSRFKEVVPIEDATITKKIHSTWRLQYLKDVVLARILDDPTFGVLNSLIFFNQVDIVTHLQANSDFLKELFSLIDGADTPTAKRKDAVCFIQQCCAIAKNLQGPARANLYQNFIQNGLLSVIVFALGQKDAPVRIAGTEILVAMIDHDPAMVRAHVFKAISEKKTPLTDTLIDLLLIEDDLGVKAQAADAVKILLDPQQAVPAPEGMARMGEQFMAKYRGNPAHSQQTESFIQDFYDNGARKLFAPLKALEQRENMSDMTYNEQSLYLYLVEILMYFVRSHLFRSKFFIASESICPRIAQLVTCPIKHLKLSAIKFFRTCLQIGDEFYYQQLINIKIFTLIFDVVYENRHRDNLLNSACLDIFEYVRRDTIKTIIEHLAENYRTQLEELTYVTVFHEILNLYERFQNPYVAGEMEGTLFDTEQNTPIKKGIVNGGNQRWQGVQEMDAQEEEYFNTSDDEDELAAKPPKILPSMSNGTSPLMKPLVDYPDDEEDSKDDTTMQSFYERTPVNDENERPTTKTQEAANDSAVASTPPQAPPERLSEKRRREEDEEDELGKLTTTKRRSSSISSVGSTNSGKMLRRKQNFSTANDGAGGKKIAITLAVKSPAEAENGEAGSGGEGSD